MSAQSQASFDSMEWTWTRDTSRDRKGPMPSDHHIWCKLGCGATIHQNNLARHTMECAN